MADIFEIHFAVKTVEPSVVVEADRQILVAAVASLIQNAFERRGGRTDSRPYDR